MGDRVALRDDPSLGTGSCASIRSAVRKSLPQNQLKAAVVYTETNETCADRMASDFLVLPRLASASLVSQSFAELPHMTLTLPLSLTRGAPSAPLKPLGALDPGTGWLIVSIWPSPSHHSSRMILGSGVFNVWRHDPLSNEESGSEAGSGGALPTRHAVQMVPAVRRAACCSLNTKLFEFQAIFTVLISKSCYCSGYHLCWF